MTDNEEKYRAALEQIAAPYDEFRLSYMPIYGGQFLVQNGRYWWPEIAYYQAAAYIAREALAVGERTMETPGATVRGNTFHGSVVSGDMGDGGRS